MLYDLPPELLAMLPPSQVRGTRIKATKDRKIDEKFRGRKWDIVKEVHLPEGQVMVTVFGCKARHGWVLRDRETGEQVVVGWNLLKRIHDVYLGVNLPPETARKKSPD